MPKLKTKKSIAKRMKVTKSGKVMRRRIAKGHMRVTKSAKQTRSIRQDAQVVGKIADNYRELIQQ